MGVYRGHFFSSEGFAEPKYSACCRVITSLFAEVTLAFKKTCFWPENGRPK
jgi:hypothetical protein